ncbi:MAG: hypothetical protein JSW47_20675 [Phycisphaerales bacterium]|nr:MAG: hypothetical protein JSW47_20675 [Phycisphaerales bacterium]
MCDIGPMPWGDGIVDEADLEVLMERWGEKTPVYIIVDDFESYSVSLGSQKNCQVIVSEFPVRLGVAVPRAVNRLVTFDAHDYTHRILPRVILSLYGHGYRLVIGRPQNIRTRGDAVYDLRLHISKDSER